MSFFSAFFHIFKRVMCVKNRGQVLFRISLVLISAFILMTAAFLCACERVIRDASDELVMNSWSAALDGGAKVSLTFEEDNAVFSVTNGDVSSSLEGLCILSAEQFTVCDEETGENYTFDYRLFGDHIELTYNNSTIILLKC